MKCTDLLSWLRGSFWLWSIWIPWSGLKTSPFLPHIKHFAMFSCLPAGCWSPEVGLPPGSPFTEQSRRCLLSLLQAVGQWLCVHTYSPSLQRVSAQVMFRARCHCSGPQWLYLSCPLPNHGNSGLGLAFWVKWERRICLKDGTIAKPMTWLLFCNSCLILRLFGWLSWYRVWMERSKRQGGRTEGASDPGGTARCCDGLRRTAVAVGIRSALCYQY